ncbi:hypothetical protein JTB14_035641 [Gonioctena quinquepunctata]|nr:hypothetical protein JTB14_035641 [Gonioctena quinquepunctata]
MTNSHRQTYAGKARNSMPKEKFIKPKENRPSVEKNEEMENLEKARKTTLKWKQEGEELINEIKEQTKKITEEMVSKLYGQAPPPLIQKIRTETYNYQLEEVKEQYREKWK